MENKKQLGPIFFSVIIPLYNKAEYIISTLNSVINQTFTNFEIIIVNDGSTDNSIDCLKKNIYSNITLINQTNQGVSSARNNGIKNAKGKYIVFLDADDYWYPNHLNEFNLSITKHSHESVFCNNYEIYTKKTKLISTKFSHNFNIKETTTIINNYFKSSLLSDIAWTSAVCLKKDILKDDLLFDTKLASGQDTDLWIRLGLNYNFIFNQTITARHNKFIEKSLSKSNTIKPRYHFTLKYLEEEKSNLYLKKYLDNNRFAIALQCKERGEKDIFNKLHSEIDIRNLNYKQKIILILPVFLITFFKKIKLLLEHINVNILLYK